MIRSEIEFKCKQFWSNEQNKITAEVFPREGKKAILKVRYHNPVLLIWILDPDPGFLLNQIGQKIWPFVGEGVGTGLIRQGREKLLYS
jgi:hypothetical protein